jgi:hypothetical protein
MPSRKFFDFETSAANRAFEVEGRKSAPRKRGEMKGEAAIVGSGEICCSQCHSEAGFEVVRGPRFREPLRGMARMVILPSLLALALACVAFLWLGRAVTPGTETVVDSSAVRAVLGLAVVLCAAAAGSASILILATKPVARCVGCGAIEEKDGG